MYFIIICKTVINVVFPTVLHHILCSHKLFSPFMMNGDGVVFCHNCGANVGNAKFCPECGTRIVTQEEPASRGSGTLTLRKYNARKMKDISADI